MFEDKRGGAVFEIELWEIEGDLDRVSDRGV